MATSRKNVVRKKRGRPATGQDPVTAIRLSSALRASVDKWAATQDDEPGRSEAIRRLVELGLSVAKPHSVGAHKGASKAKSLAREQIEKLSDPTVTDDERQHRRRRLLKGPEEFREIRTDLPKPKR